jgi:hypothetical protein
VNKYTNGIFICIIIDRGFRCVLGTYHKITIDDVNDYREYNLGLDSYEELLTEKEFLEIIKNEVVEEEIEVVRTKLRLLCVVFQPTVIEIH